MGEALAPWALAQPYVRIRIEQKLELRFQLADSLSLHENP
jgi:hypothetical protein